MVTGRGIPWGSAPAISVISMSDRCGNTGVAFLAAYSDAKSLLLTPAAGLPCCP